MITKEMLKPIQGLTEEQMQAIIELSKNDEDRVIAEKTREFWTNLDKDIKEVTGKEKPATQKTYDFFKETLKEFKKKADDVDAAILKKTNELNERIVELQKKIKEGSQDEALKKELEQTKQKLAEHETRAKRLEADLKKKEREFEKGLKEKEDAMLAMRVDTVLAKTLSGLKFKEGIPQEVIPVLTEKAKAEILAKGTPDFTEDGDFIIRDKETGLPITNPENYQKPFTGSELFLQSLAPVIADGPGSKRGAGSGAGAGGGEKTFIVSAKTQMEAISQIEKHLAEKGVPKGTAAYQEEMDKIVEENKVLDLPAQETAGA